MSPADNTSALPSVISWLFRVTSAPRLAVGPSLLQALWHGMRCLTTSEIRRWDATHFNTSSRHFYSRGTSFSSALEVLHDYALHKFTIDTDTECLSHTSFSSSSTGLPMNTMILIRWFLPWRCFNTNCTTTTTTTTTKSTAHYTTTTLCLKQESSAKLTNQHVSYAFTSSPFNFHARHILPASKFQYSYSCILLIFYRHLWTACIRTVSVNTVHWFDASSSGNPNE